MCSLIAFLLPAAHRNNMKGREPGKQGWFSIYSFFFYLFLHQYNKYMVVPAIWDAADIPVIKADEIFKITCRESRQ